MLPKHLLDNDDEPEDSGSRPTPSPTPRCVHTSVCTYLHTHSHTRTSLQTHAVAHAGAAPHGVQVSRQSVQVRRSTSQMAAQIRHTCSQYFSYLFIIFTRLWMCCLSFCSRLAPLPTPEITASPTPRPTPPLALFPDDADPVVPCYVRCSVCCHCLEKETIKTFVNFLFFLESIKLFGM